MHVGPARDGGALMQPLRLMTFNVQLLPVIAGVGAGTVSVPAGIIGLIPGTASDSIERAEEVADDLLAIPPNERPTCSRSTRCSARTHATCSSTA